MAEGAEGDETLVNSDQEHLISDENSNRGRFRKCTAHPRLIFFVLILALILIGHGLAVYFIYFGCSSLNCASLKVVAMNTWGMPKLFGSELKPERMKAIGDLIAKGDYDVFLMEELWLQDDHEALASRAPPDFMMTGFRQLSLPTCDGRASPFGCSGLAIVSRYNFSDVEFNTFTDHGDGAKAFVDGEVLARKGVGRVRIDVFNVSVDVFVTHTAADPDPVHGYNNSYYRVRQVRELMKSYVSKSTADIVILGGDFNAHPDTDEYGMVRDYMINSVQEIFYRLDEWLSSKFATYGNAANTFSGGKYSPVIYDYIFHRSNQPNRTQSWTYWFELPLFQTPYQSSEISLSDHEAIISTIYFWK